jgi:hypothetical protein
MPVFEAAKLGRVGFVGPHRETYYEAIGDATPQSRRARRGRNFIRKPAAARAIPGRQTLVPDADLDLSRGGSYLYEQPPPGLSVGHLEEAAKLHVRLDAKPGTESLIYIPSIAKGRRSL